MPRTNAVSPVFVLLALAPAVLGQPQAVLVDGDPLQGKVAGVGGQWQIALAGAAREVHAADLLLWGRWAEPGRGPFVLLACGSLLVGDVLSADRKTLAVDSLVFGEVKLPLDRVAGIVFQPPAEPLRRDQLLDRVVSAQGQSDSLLLANGDQVAGTFQAIEKGKVRLRSAVGPIDVETHRARALIFNPALARREGAKGLHAVAGFTDGSRLDAAALAVDEKNLRITLTGGPVWTAAPAELAALQPLGGKAVYLSDLPAAGYRHVPYLDLKWPYKTDRNVLGGLLRSGGRVYLKGLGMHSAARLSYELAEPFRRFQAELAVDDQAEGRGSVGFRVFVDGRQKYASPTVRGGQPPVPVSVDLAGAKRLDLVVDFADRADELDYADWLHARLLR